MPFQPRPRLPSVLASVLAAGLMITMTGCTGHLTPVGPGTPPQPHHLRSPIVLQAVRIQPPKQQAGAGPAQSRSPGAGQCYRKLDRPVTLTSAAVSTLISVQPATPSGPAAGPRPGVFMVALPGFDAAALTAVTTTATDAHGYLALTVAGRTWLLPKVLAPFTQA